MSSNAEDATTQEGAGRPFVPPGRPLPGQQGNRRARGQRPGPPPQLDFPPVRNGLDYLDSAVDYLDENDAAVTTRDLKYAVLHLQAAVEVLLKARLLAEHWTLVFADLHQATRKKLESADFKSVTTDAAVLRLRNIVGVPISDEEQKALKNLSDDRNKLQHFGLTHDAYAVEARAAAVLDFLIRFCDEQLLPCLTIEEERREAERSLLLLRDGLNSIESFVRERMSRIGGELKDEGVEHRTIRCPGCTQLAIVVSPSTSESLYEWKTKATCRFCSEGWDTTELASYFGDFAQDELGDWNSCPQCNRWALGSDVCVRSDPAMSVFFCFSCAVAFPSLRHCMLCDRTVDVTRATDTALCRWCEMDVADRDAEYEDPAACALSEDTTVAADEKTPVTEGDGA
ncbi:serine/arginine repetitive matrix protein 1 [Streptomyces sp. NPDC012421]|uniref:serine/arginine repetitive matrix protein 1 n=1 Tax=Streptomyces sp. NPDC012421 TaxID=3364832 RepID=UPI0036F076D2